MIGLTQEEEKLAVAIAAAATVLEAQLAVSAFLAARIAGRRRIKPAPPFDPAAPAKCPILGQSHLGNTEEPKSCVNPTNKV